MKSTGVVRKVDELGRIVLPIELRKILDIKQHDPIEIFMDNDKIILQKYQPGRKRQHYIRTLQTDLSAWRLIMLSGRTEPKSDLCQSKNLHTWSPSVILEYTGINQNACIMFPCLPQMIICMMLTAWDWRCFSRIFTTFVYFT